MGQVLTKPITEKSSESDLDARLIYAVSSMQGWRTTMEDKHSAVLSMDKIQTDLEPEELINKNYLSFFGVYDGHGGSQSAEYSEANFPRVLKEQHEYQQGNYCQALIDSYLSLDDELHVVYDPIAHHGCTAVTALISDNAIYVANAGDSRAVLSVNGSAKPLSFDHKPTHHGEYHRIINAGGFVERGRVNGKLALSRAIGDFEFKDQPRVTSKAPQFFAVTANPEVITRTLTSDDEFLILACDGIWDCATSQKVVGFIRRSIAEGQELDFICENFMNYCLADVNNMMGIGTDNMTIMIVGFLNGRTKKEWYELIRTRVLNGEGPAATVDEVKPKLVEKEDTLIDENDRLNLVDEVKTQPTSISLQQLLGIDASIKNENGIMVIHNKLAATLTQLANPASESSPTSTKDEE